ncbi:hypothetical protein ACFE04_006960 [Oxalis oulophora]
MAVITDLFTGEIAKELINHLYIISCKSCSSKSTAEGLKKLVDDLLPVIQEIKYSGVELPSHRQFQLDRLSESLIEGGELADQVLSMRRRWNLYRNLQLTRKMEKLVKTISRFVNIILPAHVLADLHHLRFENAERFDKLDAKIEKSCIGVGQGGVGGGGGGGGGWIVSTPAEGVEVGKWKEVSESEQGLGLIGLELGKRKVKEMLISNKDDKCVVVGVSGIGGSGKTTLVSHVCRDEEVKCHFKNRILFLTVSQSPNVDHLKATIWGFLSGINSFGNNVIPEWNLQYDWKIESHSLVVLDDVWSLSVLKKLIFNVPGCKTLVVSRFKFPNVFNSTYEMELLREDEAISLFCHYAFGQKSIPHGANKVLVKQIVSECKSLPLALKVIGSSLPHQPEMYWASARKRLARSEPICESHENELLERMATTVEYLPKKVKECFLDLGSFPEDKKIPLDVLVNMWAEIHDLDEEEAFSILMDLSDKNLLTLVKDARVGEMYSSFYDISITQHDVLRDLAIYLSNRGEINERKRLLMPKRETELPREWERNSDKPFNAQIVSINIGEMNERDWFQMQFPKAEVLIINFSGNHLFLPPFINNMPKIRALIVINCSAVTAMLKNFSVFSNLASLRSLWLEKVSVTHLNGSTIPLKNLRKISLILCKLNNRVSKTMVDLPHIFPCLSELTIDHCDDLSYLPSTTSKMKALKRLSITNCPILHELPADLGKLESLEILRLYACPELKTLPPSVCDLIWLKYLDVSQCVNMKYFPEDLGKLESLEKIDMRECPALWNVPKSASSLKSIRRVICDEEVSSQWEELKNALPNLSIQVEQKSFDLDWLFE